VSFAAVLFDLDGTLVDTAPDLARALNRLLTENDLPKLPYAIARNVASHGALGLIRAGFGELESESRREALRRRFIELYAEKLCVDSRLFIALSEISAAAGEVPWGVVTNKPEGLTATLLERLGVDTAASCVVGGDRLPQRKPHPAPLLLAATELGVPAERCVYIGDAARDIEAGKAAGMATVTAAYGYIRPGEDLAAWQADAIALYPQRLFPVVNALAERALP
jgi:phosphoglycolate phosphatase